jgi:hypothetical protein
MKASSTNQAMLMKTDNKILIPGNDDNDDDDDDDI